MWLATDVTAFAHPLLTITMASGAGHPQTDHPTGQVEPVPAVYSRLLLLPEHRRTSSPSAGVETEQRTSRIAPHPWQEQVWRRAYSGCQKDRRRTAGVERWCLSDRRRATAMGVAVTWRSQKARHSVAGPGRHCSRCRYVSMCVTRAIMKEHVIWQGWVRNVYVCMAPGQGQRERQRAHATSVQGDEMQPGASGVVGGEYFYLYTYSINKENKQASARAHAATYKRLLPPVLMLNELDRPKPAIAVSFFAEIARLLFARPRSLPPY